MSPHLARRVEQLKTSLWTLPLAAVVLGSLLGLVLPALDRDRFLHTALSRPAWLEQLLQLPGSQARSLLGTLASAVATALGVLFSITIVALQLASTQYSPRVLRRFMGDRPTQAVLAVFIAAVAYLVVVALSLPQGAAPPRLSLLGAILLALLCFCLVGYFLHHLARSIDAATIVRSIGQDTEATLRRLRVEPTPQVATPATTPRLLRSATAGYLELVDEQHLLRAAPPGTKVMRIEVRTGDFVLPGLPLVAIWPATDLDQRTCKRLHLGFAFAQQRSLDQDVLFGIRQLVDVSLKALSPAINDVTTAYMAVNEIGVVIQRFLSRDGAVEDGWRVERRAGCELHVPSVGLRTLLRHAFDEIARSSSAQLRVPARMFELMGQAILATGPNEAQRKAMAEAARWIHGSVAVAESTPIEKQEFEERYRWLLQLAAGVVHEEREPALH